MIYYEHNKYHTWCFDFTIYNPTLYKTPFEQQMS